MENTRQSNTQGEMEGIDVRKETREKTRERKRRQRTMERKGETENRMAAGKKAFEPKQLIRRDQLNRLAVHPQPPPQPQAADCDFVSAP